MSVSKKSRKSSSAFSPVKIDFTFCLDEDGGIIVVYEGADDPRVDTVAMAVIQSIANEYDFGRVEVIV